MGWGQGVDEQEKIINGEMPRKYAKKDARPTLGHPLQIPSYVSLGGNLGEGEGVDREHLGLEAVAPDMQVTSALKKGVGLKTLRGIYWPEDLFVSWFKRKPQKCEIQTVDLGDGLKLTGPVLPKSMGHPEGTTKIYDYGMAEATRNTVLADSNTALDGQEVDRHWKAASAAHKLTSAEAEEEVDGVVSKFMKLAGGQKKMGPKDEFDDLFDFGGVEGEAKKDAKAPKSVTTSEKIVLEANQLMRDLADLEKFTPAQGKNIKGMLEKINGRLTVPLIKEYTSGSTVGQTEDTLGFKVYEELRDMQDIFSLTDSLATCLSDKDVDPKTAYAKCMKLLPHSSGKVTLSPKMLETILQKEVDLGASKKDPARVLATIDQQTERTEGVVNLAILPTTSQRAFQTHAVAKLYWDLLDDDKDTGPDTLRAFDEAVKEAIEYFRKTKSAKLYRGVIYFNTGIKVMNAAANATAQRKEDDTYELMIAKIGTDATELPALDQMQTLEDAAKHLIKFEAVYGRLAATKDCSQKFKSKHEAIFQQVLGTLGAYTKHVTDKIFASNQAAFSSAARWMIANVKLAGAQAHDTFIDQDSVRSEGKQVISSAVASLQAPDKPVGLLSDVPEKHMETEMSCYTEVKDRARAESGAFPSQDLLELVSSKLDLLMAADGKVRLDDSEYMKLFELVKEPGDSLYKYTDFREWAKHIDTVFLSQFQQTAKTEIVMSTPVLWESVVNFGLGAPGKDREDSIVTYMTRPEALAQGHERNLDETPGKDYKDPPNLHAMADTGDGLLKVMPIDWTLVMEQHCTLQTIREAMAALVDLDTLSDELTNFKAASDALAEVTDESSPVKDIYPNKTSLTVISDSVQNIANAVFGHNVQAFVTAITDKLNEISELLKHPTLADVTDAVAALPKLDDTVCTRFKEVAGGQESVRLHKLCKDVEAFKPLKDYFLTISSRIPDELMTQILEP
ncbi:unnamed protein product, partial [Prorocentrum cordatum]